MFRAHQQRRGRGIRRLVAPFVLALGLAACGGGSNSAPTGTVRLSLTDAPTCGYDTVYVTVEKVRLHMSASAGDADAGWSEVALDQPKRIDLLGLVDGVLSDLGQTDLPAGHYTQMRLVLANTAPTDSPPPNAITPSDTLIETALEVPSGEESGLKMNVGIDVPADQVTHLVIDFDACRSFVKTGSGQILLKPVLSVKPIP